MLNRDKTAYLQTSIKLGMIELIMMEKLNLMEERKSKNNFLSFLELMSLDMELGRFNMRVFTEHCSHQDIKLGYFQLRGRGNMLFNQVSL